MGKTFKEKWLEAVDKKNSILCAGLDPADFEMGRGEKGLPEGVDKLEWAKKYIEAVAPFVAAIKPNIQYWKGEKDSEALYEVCDLAKSLGLLVIDDSKLADIGSTNDAGLFYAKKRQADAVTLAPFAGNLKEAKEQASKRDIGVITMVLMSNPEYKLEKNELTKIRSNQENTFDGDIKWYKKDTTVPSKFKLNFFVPKYIKRSYDANKFGIDGVVIGAPSKKNHITTKEIRKTKKYLGDKVCILMPGIGFQGGNAKLVLSVYGDDTIASSSRNVMFPNGNKSTPQEQAGAAKYNRDQLNEIRYKK